jgi:hypothetical protein
MSVEGTGNDGSSRVQQTKTSSLVRVNLNLTPEADQAVSAVAERKGISRTEAIRRALAITKFFDDEMNAGRTIQTVDSDGKIREPVIL